MLVSVFCKTRYLCCLYRINNNQFLYFIFSRLSSPITGCAFFCTIFCDSFFFSGKLNNLRITVVIENGDPFFYEVVSDEVDIVLTSSFQLPDKLVFEI